MQCHQAVGRAHEVDAAPAIVQLVSHHFRDRQLGQGFVQGLLQAFSQFGPWHDDVQKQHVGLAVVFPFQAVDSGSIRAQCGQFLDQRRCGLTLGVQANADGHQFLRQWLVSGLRGHVGDVRGQSARRGERCHRGVGCGQTLRLERFEQGGRERLAQLFQCFWRQLFNKQFDE